MNRSILQIWNNKWFNFFLLILIIFATINNSIFVSCTNIINYKEFSQYMLKEITHNNITFRKVNTINDYSSRITIDLLLEQKLKNNWNYKVSKYFLNKNGILMPFNLKTPYAHPNLYLGTFNNISINMQFSHKRLNNDFDLFLNNDINGVANKQFLCNKIYMYPNNELAQIILNFNDISLNQQYLNLNKDLINENIKNSLKVQKFLENNEKKLNSFIDLSLKN